MLGSLTGSVIAQLDQRVLIDVNGVGYWVYTGSWQPTGELTCYLYHHIREEASDLYGFADIFTLQLFEQLLEVNGVGPKVALAILSLGTPARVADAIRSSDATFLAMAPGIGPKAAQKIILELKNKVAASEENHPSIHQDLIEALEGLGYRLADVRPLLGDIPTSSTTLDSQIKWALKQLGKKN